MFYETASQSIAYMKAFFGFSSGALQEFSRPALGKLVPTARRSSRTPSLPSSYGLPLAHTPTTPVTQTLASSCNDVRPATSAIKPAQAPPAASPGPPVQLLRLQPASDPEGPDRIPPRLGPRYHVQGRPISRQEEGRRRRWSTAKGWEEEPGWQRA